MDIWWILHQTTQYMPTTIPIVDSFNGGFTQWLCLKMGYTPKWQLFRTFFFWKSMIIDLEVHYFQIKPK